MTQFYPAGCVMIFGVVLATLHQAISPLGYECRDCGKKFHARSLGARTILVLCFGFVLWVAVGLIRLYHSPV